MKLARNIGITILLISLAVGIYGAVNIVPNPSPLPAPLSVQGVKEQKEKRIAPDYLYPDTKGEIATSDFKELTAVKKCGTYSKCHRGTTSGMKKEVCENYECVGTFQIDHVVALAMGGADSIENLWAQPEKNYWNGTNYGFHEKDRLEAFLIRQLKSGIIEPTEAQKCIAQDWVLCYRENLQHNFGGIGDIIDEDDEVYE